MQRSNVRRFILTAALLIGMAALEGLLLRVAGPPSSHLRVLAELGSPMAEPLEGTLAALALTAQALAAYLVLALALRTLTQLPGFVGQLADRAERMFTVPAVRRALDALLGGALLAHLVVAPPTAASVTATMPAPPAAHAAIASIDQRSSWPGPLRPTDPGERVESRAPASPVAPSPIPLPIWLGGDALLNAPVRPSARGGSGSDLVPSPPSTADERSRPQAHAAGVHHAVEIQPGDTLWRIAAAELPAELRSDSIIARYWRQIYGVNRRVLGADPDRILPGVALSIPPHPSPSTEL
jgi:nucleoid-associated protein YgaU